MQKNQKIEPIDPLASKKNQSSEKSIKTTTVFDHINHIREIKDPDYYKKLNETDQKNFNKYIILMGLGMDVGVIENVCYVSKYFDILSNESFYKVCCDITPKAKKYCKWIKSSKPKYGKKIVDIICNYYKIGKSEAYEYCKTFYKDVDGLTELTKICSDLGYEDEQIEKFLKGSDE